MNREIKFRAYHGDPGQGTMKFNVGVHPFMIFRLSDQDLCEKGEYNDNSGDLVVAPNCYNVMQYTGLKDTNGKEIYEGDILQFGQDLLSVEYSHGSYFGRQSENNPSRGYLGCETFCISSVIGNIYEHPHLLEPAVSPAKTTEP